MNKVNQAGCWQKHHTWKTARSVVIDDMNLTDKQKEAIRNGHEVTVGDWIFSPIKEEVV